MSDRPQPYDPCADLLRVLAWSDDRWREEAFGGGRPAPYADLSTAVRTFLLQHELHAFCYGGTSAQFQEAVKRTERFFPAAPSPHDVS